MITLFRFRVDVTGVFRVSPLFSDLLELLTILGCFRVESAALGCLRSRRILTTLTGQRVDWKQDVNKITNNSTAMQI